MRTLARWAAALFGVIGIAAAAQGLPNKTLSLIVPYPAGGPSDYVARKIQPDAAARLGQTMIIENIGGANGSIALSRMLNAPPDGSMMVLGTPMELVLAPLAMSAVKFKSEDFRLVAQLVTTNLVLLTRPTLGAKNVDELVAMARKATDKPMTYGSVGLGSAYHVAGEKFAQLTGTQFTHVPYKGSAQLITDLVGGQIDFAFIVLAGSVPAMIQDGKVKALGITAKTPHPLFKDLPPLAAMPALAPLEFDLWAGVQVPRNTPDDVVARLNKAFYEALQDPETRKAFEATGNAVVSPRSPAELDTLYVAEVERYRALAKSINLQPQ